MALKNYRIHRDLDRGEFRKTLGYALILSIFFAMVLFYIRQSILKVHIENEINRQIFFRNSLSRTKQRLRLERGFLRSFSRIEKEARDRLGFIDPDPGQLIILKAESLIKPDS